MESEKSTRLLMLVSDKMISYTDGSINHNALNQISLILADIRNSGMQVSLVSAGAIIMGIQILKIRERPETLSQKQAISAVGQVELIKCYQDLFNIYGQNVAQVLLTRKMIFQEEYRSNLKATMDELLKIGVIPIINENDSVSTDDIELEDNYPLAVKLAEIIDAQIMIIASDIKNKYHIITKGNNNTYTAYNEDDLYSYIETINTEFIEDKSFPKSRHDLILNDTK